jgi:hypothetical protein
VLDSSCGGRGSCQRISPGQIITLNTAADVEAFPAAMKKYLAMHELGHTLGFVHPEGASSSQHIPGTSGGTSYTTVMHETFVQLLGELSSDDVASRNKMLDFCQ